MKNLLCLLLANVARVGLAADDHCSKFHDRVKSAQNIFYNVQSGDAEFVDGSFPEDTMVRWDAHPSAQADLSTVQLSYVDSIDIIFSEDQGYSLFGRDGIRSTDIYQGQLGNCWFMHGASAVGAKPSRIENLFLNDELSNNGIYGLNFYALGVPTTVLIDDMMPLDGSGNLIFARESKDGALWGPILEKGFAKLSGTYENIVGGDPIISIQTLTGAPSTRFYHKGHSSNIETFNKHPEIVQYEALEVFEAIQNAPVDSMISALSPGESNTELSRTGLTQAHVYTVLDTHVVEGQRLLRIRNPWGQETYKGPWSDDDAQNWDKSLQQEAKTFKERFPELYKKEDNGIFFIDYLTYFQEFHQTQIHLDTSDMEQAFFLVQDDESLARADGPFCQQVNGCTSSKHMFTVSSEQTQTVYLSVHTWPLRSYPRDCQVDANNFPTGPAAAQHIFNLRQRNGRLSSNEADIYIFWSEEYQVPAFTMDAGSSMTVTLEMDWQQNATKDFSLVVWGTGKAVTIEADGWQTKRSFFPYTAKRADDMNAPQENGSDNCNENPQWAAFKEWYESFDGFPTSECSTTQNWSSIEGVYEYYIFRGGCDWADSVYLSFAQTQTFWDNVVISEGAVLMETKAVNSQGLVQKKFNCKSGSGNMDRVAFYINLKDPTFAGETFGSFGEVIVDFGAVDRQQARRRGNWEKIRAPVTPGCGQVEFTDGAGQEEEWDEPEVETQSASRKPSYDFWGGQSGATGLVLGTALAATLLLTS